jgi:alkanesulfonate monooxygenase SsuD/methylene tetrahydromethanopterin reductase-like flavin-dependent oxidoreductase (luciferase family)
MRFGHFTVMPNPGLALPFQTLLDMIEEQAQLAERLGYEIMWFGEHHFGSGMVEPNPVMGALHVAGVTERMRLGLAAMILPQWHPIRAAEDLALLDHYTRGRLEAGFGRGNSPQNLFNTDADRRDEERSMALFAEQLDVIIKAWTQDPFSHEGRFYHFSSEQAETRNAGGLRRLTIEPKPFQKPMPPMWIVVDRTPGVILGAERGIRPILWLRDRDGCREAFAAYRDTVANMQGEQLEIGERCGLLKVVVVADSFEKARRIAEPIVTQRVFNFGRSRFLFGDHAESNPNAVLAAATQWDELMARDALFVGSPDSVGDQIAQLQEDFKISDLLCWMWLPEMEQRDVLRSMELLAERVMPRFARSETAMAGTGSTV